MKINRDLDLRTLSKNYVRDFTTEELVQNRYLIANAAIALLSEISSKVNIAEFKSLVLSSIKAEINEREKQALIEISKGEFFSEDEVQW